MSVKFKPADQRSSYPIYFRRKLLEADGQPVLTEEGKEKWIPNLRGAYARNPDGSRNLEVFLFFLHIKNGLNQTSCERVHIDIPLAWYVGLRKNSGVEFVADESGEIVSLAAYNKAQTIRRAKQKAAEFKRRKALAESSSTESDDEVNEA